jgi:hypothetical protein
MVRRANKICRAGARLHSHLPGEPVKARVNPVQTFVVTVRSLVLILKTFIVFHATRIGLQRRVCYGVFTLMYATEGQRRGIRAISAANITNPVREFRYSELAFSTIPRIKNGDLLREPLRLPIFKKIQSLDHVWSLEEVVALIGGDSK